MEKNEILDQYYRLLKNAAKSKSSRKRISKDLDKAKSEYGKAKIELDGLEDEKAKLDAKLEKAKQECNVARKHMLKLHKTVQTMDISNASDAVFYNDDSDDIGFMIRGKEFHINIKDDGDVELVPMLQHRRSKKHKDEDDEVVETIPDEDVDDLYNSLITE